MGATGGEVDPTAMARAEELLDGFLADRKDRTLQAYTADLDDFARFLDRTSPAAMAHLLGGGDSAGRRLVLDYAIDLQRRGRAPATIDRRLSTLRALVRTALDRGLVDWLLETPTEDQYSAALDQYAASDSEHYLLPRHRGEIDRLDIQHYAFRAVLRANYAAPVDTPARVLDVGCGTGQWAFEVCEQFPDCLVVGFDLVAGKPEQPPRYRWVKGNLLPGLSFGDAGFDFVHMRYLVLGVPVASWPAVVADLVRVTRPGGWVELAEAPLEVDGAGPATERLFSLTRELSASLGLDLHRVVFSSLDGYLRGAGLEEVERREISLPIGRWGGEIGSLMATDNRAGWTRVCEVLQARSVISAAEARELIHESHEEAQWGRMSWPAAIAFGRKANRG
jgi:SAM-dependent methyltransferase